MIMIMTDSDATDLSTSWGVLHGAYYYMGLIKGHGKPSQQSVKASRGSGRLNAKVNSMSNAIPEVVHFVCTKNLSKCMIQQAFVKC